MEKGPDILHGGTLPCNKNIRGPPSWIGSACIRGAPSWTGSACTFRLFINSIKPSSENYNMHNFFQWLSKLVWYTLLSRVLQKNVLYTLLIGFAPSLKIYPDVIYSTNQSNDINSFLCFKVSFYFLFLLYYIKLCFSKCLLLFIYFHFVYRWVSSRRITPITLIIILLVTVT